MGDHVTFKSNQGETDAYLALPAGGRGPGVVLIGEPAVADRLAQAGFVTLLPDLPVGAADAVARSVEGATAFLSGQDAVETPVMGAVGFGPGGARALWSATVAEPIQTVVAFQPIGWDGAGRDWSSYDGKVVLIHAGPDGLTADTQAALEAIEAAGGTVEVHLDPDTGWDRTVEFLRQHLG